MDRLPVEILEDIVKQLSPKDLARCSCVSRKWRDIFNQDWIWGLHCDYQLDEMLQTIPCMSTKPFKKPEHPSLSPMCSSKLALIMEKHLWNNWRQHDFMDVKEIRPNHITCEGVDFLTDTLILVRSSVGVEILDISVTPNVIVATQAIREGVYCTPGSRRNYKYIFKGTPNQASDTGEKSLSAIGTLFEIREKFLMIYNVDTVQKSILFKDKVSLGKTHCFTKDLFINLIRNQLTPMVIFDLNTQRTVEKTFEPFPNFPPLDKYDPYFSPILDCKLISSNSSNFLAVQICFYCSGNSHAQNYRYYIFNIDELVFSPDPVYESQRKTDILLYKQYLALCNLDEFTILDIHTKDVLFTKAQMWLNFETAELQFVFNDAFVFLERSRKTHTQNTRVNNEVVYLRMFFPSSKTLTTVFKCQDGRLLESFKIVDINSKFLGLMSPICCRVERLWEMSGQTLKDSKMDTEYLSECLHSTAKINKSFTKVIFKRETLFPHSVEPGACCGSIDFNFGPTSLLHHLLRHNSETVNSEKWYVKHFW